MAYSSLQVKICMDLANLYMYDTSVLSITDIYAVKSVDNGNYILGGCKICLYSTLGTRLTLFYLGSCIILAWGYYQLE